jgi:hypothetical protein
MLRNCLTALRCQIGSNWERIESDHEEGGHAVVFYAATGKELKDINRHLSPPLPLSPAATGKELKVHSPFPKPPATI